MRLLESQAASVPAGNTTLRVVIVRSAPSTMGGNCPEGKCICLCGECSGDQAHAHCSGGGHSSGCHKFC